jgi:hypothetical protein
MVLWPRRMVYQVLAEVLAHLPAVLFLAAIVVIAHHSHLYRQIEGFSVKLVSAISVPDISTLGEHGGIVALTTSPKFFYKEFDGRLPANRAKIAEILAMLSDVRPRLIAVDINVMRTGDTEQERMEADKLIKAIAAALNNGIDVVAAIAPATPDKPLTQVDVERWQDVCDQISARTGGSTLGRFALTNPLLAPEQPFNLVYRFNKNPPKGSNDYYSLARAISELNETPQKRTPASHSLCTVNPNDIAQICLLAHNQQEWPDFEDMQRIRFMGFGRGKHVSQWPPVDSLDELHKQDLSKLRGKTVLVGMRSFSGIDEFVAPIGEIPGVLLQAHLANSLNQAMGDSAWLAVFYDVLLGLVFVLVYVLMQRYLQNVNAPNTTSLLSLLLPLFLFGSMLLVVLIWCADLFARGQWLDPLPMMVGLSLHLYVESNASEHHAHPTLSRWLSQTVSSWRISLGLDGRPATNDEHVLSVIRLIMVGTVICAVWKLIHGHS